MTQFTPIASLAGGALIGLSASLLLLARGRIAGISGILGGLLKPRSGESRWRLAFVAGLLAGGALLGLVWPGAFVMAVERSTAAVVFAGLLVGFGARLGGGCTSGHGVCGLSRLSPRSLVATLVFMTTGAFTVLVTQRWLGGAL